MTSLTINEGARVLPAPMDPPPVCRKIVSRLNPRVRIYLDEDALARLWESVAVTEEIVERGGALAGRYGTHPSVGRFIAITTILPAPHARSSRAHIDIGPDDWMDIYRRMAQLPGERLLGWYHSHPGLSLWLSNTDCETQRNVFGADWQVALVLDPLSGRFRFYQGADARRARWVAISAPGTHVSDDSGARGVVEEIFGSGPEKVDERLHPVGDGGHVDRHGMIDADVFDTD
jgi:proteasome lid subunit RPN8/RPN11